MIKISSIIIAKNEEANIGRCISSQLECIDEIIVLVDEKSEDKTLEIVKSFTNVKCYVVKWMGYSKTKEYAVSLASNEWIFWIDSDETITKELCDEINLLKKKDILFSAYSFPRKANFLGRWILHSGWYPGRVTRLFNKNKVSFSEDAVHEHLVVNGKIGELNSDLEHFTDPSIHHYFNKFNNYTSLAAEELYNNSRKFSLSDVLVRPPFLFIKMYFFKRGFLDGLQGLILALFSSAYVFTKYCKLWELKIKKG
jgi:glycosyltransferase involved in cell wall biosynthesis